MEFKINPEAKIDIQNLINYYNSQKEGLGKKFHLEIKNYFTAIKKNPYYQIRYNNVRCIPLRKFPVMIHYTIDVKLEIVIIRAVINTNLNPKTNWLTTFL